MLPLEADIVHAFEPSSEGTPRGLRRALALAFCLAVAGCSEPGDEGAAVPTTPRDPPVFGAYVPSAPWNDLHTMLELESEVGLPFDIAHWFTSWDLPYDPVPTATVLEAGRVPLVSWQPHRQGVRDIADGRHDDYVRAWARGVAEAPGIVYVRPFPEMNGDWVPWNGDPAAFRAAWRRVVTLFAEEGAANVRWVFGPNVTDEPRTPENAMERYYPGDDVVDVLALSGYNWGATRPAIGWRDFEGVFRSGYDRLVALGPQAVWLAEVASAEEGGDKGAWVRDMFDRATDARFARIAALVWFNEDKETDWRIESSEASMAAFRDWARTQGP